MQTVYIALGSNVGDRAAHIDAALDAMAGYLTVGETSHLYETDPMLVTDQPRFLNAVCRAVTRLAPLDLLRAVKRTEDDLGRTKTVRYGPRNIDLDILFYDDAVVDTPELSIPHVRVPERDFVLAPMMDLEPELCHPRLGVKVRRLWRQLDKPVPPRVMPIGGRLWRWGGRARVMGILNLTPDSFSGDGLAGASEPTAAAVEQGKRFEIEGADLLDVGGFSTRPGHEAIAVAEEIRRVAPVIEALRNAVNLPISIDTFRPEVAAAALEAGAAMLNDVSGLRGGKAGGRNDAAAPPDGMASLAARSRVPLVLTDNRAPLQEEDGAKAARTARPVEDAQDIVSEVRQELGRAAQGARRAGVARWLRIVDPGMGFGKTVAQHRDLMARLGDLRQLDYPLLFGCSRKGFLGKLAGGATVEQRLAPTIAANLLAAARGAQIVRVHDVRENVQALRFMNAILGSEQAFA